MTQYDVVIIGAGPGGYVAAIRARQLGLKVAIIERDQLGGVCLNVGCIPSKALIHQAELFSSIQELKDLGVGVDTTGFQYEKVFEKSRKAVETLSKGVEFLLKKDSIQIIRGHAKLRSPEEVEVDGRIYTSKYILLATGSHPHELEAFPVDEKVVLSSTGAVMLKKLPKSVIILGSGAIGIEFAYIMNAFGVQVSLFEGKSKILQQEDKEVTNLLHTVYEKRGIQIFTNAETYAMEKVPGGVTVKFKYQNTQKQLTAEVILSAVGRRANIEGLGLEVVGIVPEKGHIPVNENYQTQVPNIYAIGDLIATPQLAHIASREGELAVEHMSGMKIQPLDYTLNPSCVYSEPQIASFGLTEEKLQKSNTPYKKFVFPYRGAGKAVAINRTEGLVKILVHPETKEIHACHIIGHQATELIHEVLLAKSSELLPQDIIHMIHAHPTLSETLMEGMQGIEGRPIHV